MVGNPGKYQPDDEANFSLNEPQRKTTENFLSIISIYSSIISLVLSFFGTYFYFIDNPFYFLNNLIFGGIAYIRGFHWIIHFSITITVYTFICLLINIFIKNKFFYNLFRIPTWMELSGFKGQALVRVSYLSLLILPFIASFILNNPFKIEFMKDLSIPLNYKIGYLISVFLSIAVTLFAIGCPKEIFLIERDQSYYGTINLYIKGDINKSLIGTSSSSSVVISDEINEDKILLRMLCWLMYLLSISYGLILMYRSSIIVIMG